MNPQSMKRRQFLARAGLLSLGLSSVRISRGKALSFKTQPNILIIITDHSAQKSIGAYGNPDVKTPNIDALAAEGVRFSQVYTPCPLCQPARAAFWTSRYSHETTVRSNESSEKIPENMPTLGQLFNSAGYECYHTGKTHDAGSLKGFKKAPVNQSKAPAGRWSRHYNYDTKRDEYTVPAMIDFIKGVHEKPFLAVLDLHNPHNICGYVGNNERTESKPYVPSLDDDELPPLPDNFDVDDWNSRPLPVQYLCCTHPRLWQGAEWNERNYRHYLAAFYHFTNMADQKIGLVVQALKDADLYDNTLIVYYADHGDGMASHRMITKHASFYEETTRGPLIFRGPNLENPGRQVDGPLVSTLDVLPTLCDYADVERPPLVRGQSLWAFLRGKNPGSLHHYVVSQWHKEYNKVGRNPQYAITGRATSPGRMLRTQQYKYIKYLEGEGEEMYDLHSDPGEKKNIIDHPAYADAVTEHRELLKRYINETGDDFFSLEVDVDPGFRRSHPLGYQHHWEPYGTPVDRAYADIENIDVAVFPNPSNAVVNFNCRIDRPGEIEIGIYNSLGRQVAVIRQNAGQAGAVILKWNGIDRYGKPAATGNYFYRFLFGEFLKSGQFTMIK